MMSSMFRVRKMFSSAHTVTLTRQLLAFKSLTHSRSLITCCHVLFKESKHKPRTKPLDQDSKSNADDLDFYGFSELGATNDSTDVNKFTVEDVTPQEYTEMARERYGPKSPLESELPFGTVRFDKTPVALDFLPGNYKNTEKSHERRSRRRGVKSEHITDLHKSYQENEGFAGSSSSSNQFQSDMISASEILPDHTSSFIDEQFFPEGYMDKTSNVNVNINKKLSIEEEAATYFYENLTGNTQDHNEAVNTTVLEDEQINDTECKQNFNKSVGHENMSSGSNFIEDQFFAPDQDSRKSNYTEGQHSKASDDLAYIDEQYFDMDKSSTGLDSPQSLFGKHYDTSQGIALNEHVEMAAGTNLELDVMEERGIDAKAVKVEKPSQKQTEKQKKRNVEPNLEKNAYEVSREVRTKLHMQKKTNLYGIMNPKEYDSTGAKILTMQVPHLENVPSSDVIQVLRENIIYNHNDIVAINKPYGLPSHGGPGVHNSIGRFLKDIIPKEHLHLVHRLDKETTGVMLLARSTNMYDRLRECFRKREVEKRYLAITKNLPKMENGLIDIPIAEGTVNGKGRMVLRPYNTRDIEDVDKKRQPGSIAKTAYRVLDRGNGCAIVECMPITGLKHQVRVHLALGLNCPILGDHKYAHLDRMAPMRLHPDMLEKLKIRQSKVRHLAMHLHARSIMIPEFLKGKNLFISASLPLHFVCNMRALKLKLPPRV